MENNALAHWGIKDQKWGIRRFQNKDGSLTPEGKKRYRDKDEDSDKTPETPEERKARILRSGTAEEVMKYQGQLTNKELNDAVQRIRIENELNQISASQRTRGIDKFKKVMDDVDTIRGGVEKGLSAWNTVAKINNTFNKKQMPTIDGKYFKTDSEDKKIGKPKKEEPKKEKPKKEEPKKEEPKKTREEIHREAEKKRREEEKAAEKRRREEEKAAKKREREEADEHRKAERRMKKFAKNLKVEEYDSDYIYTDDFRDISDSGRSAYNNVSSTAVVTTSNVSRGRDAVNRILALPAASTPMLPAPRDDK